VPPEFNHGGQFAAFIEHLTDRRGGCFIDAEHDLSMGDGTATDKQFVDLAVPERPSC
jgi:hypothetical protein